MIKKKNTCTILWGGQAAYPTNILSVLVYMSPPYSFIYFYVCPLTSATAFRPLELEIGFPSTSRQRNFQYKFKIITRYWLSTRWLSVPLVDKRWLIDNVNQINMITVWLQLHLVRIRILLLYHKTTTLHLWSPAWLKS